MRRSITRSFASSATAAAVRPSPGHKVTRRRGRRPLHTQATTQGSSIPQWSQSSIASSSKDPIPSASAATPPRLAAYDAGPPLTSFSPSHSVLNEGFFSSSSSYGPNGDNREPELRRVSDHEFDVRLSRAVSLLRATLGDFMRIGLQDYDTSNVSSSSSSSGIIPGLDRLGLGAILNALGASGRAKASHKSKLPKHLRPDDDCPPVYHPRIVFKFTPPVAPEDRQSRTATSAQGKNDSKPPMLTFSGRTMYFGSAHILRHALSALFTETSVVTESARLERGPQSHGGRAEDTEGRGPPSNSSSGKSREATLLLRLTFTGVVRVTHQPHEYTVIFKYRFDPDTGMIIEHHVDRIEPAPGKKIWYGLSSAFARLAGLHPQPTPAPSGCQHSSSSEHTYNSSNLSIWEGLTGQQSGQDNCLVFATLPLWSNRRSALNRGLRPSVEGTAGPSAWQRRRNYTTQSSANRSSRVATATADAEEAASSSAVPFFSGPRSAQDMPGPSLASIWLPSFGQSGQSDLRKDINSWAPTSDDPSIVSPGASTVNPSAAELKLYRPAATLSTKNLPKILMGLSKFNLTVLVTLTGMAGYTLCPSVLAVSSSTSLLGPVGTLLAFAVGTSLCSAAANSINQLREIPYDAQMARTRNRVLPSRTISPLQAAGFAGLSTTAGVATLAMLNPLTAGLGLGTIFLYAFVYTPMKRTSMANTWIGAIVGAIPPLMGWTACTGTLHLASDLPAWSLAALLFAWQFPHFNSLSHNLSSEYARGGYRMMSVLDPSLNRRTSLRYAVSLLPICSVFLPLSGLVVSSLPYALLSLPPNLVMIHAAWKFWKEGTEKSARWCFWVSLIHLPAVLILAMACKVGLWTGIAERLGWGGEVEEKE